MSQFGFSWVDSTETTFVSGTHFRQDEDIFSLLIQGQEGQAATASVVIRNPRVGLLNANRKIWAWISWQDDDTAGTIRPLMFARLVGIPENVFAELVTLAFVSRPLDIVAQRRTLAATLAVLPYYDPVFINEDYRLAADGSTGDVDSVLEAYSKRWHISRGEDGGPLTVTASDICVGEDGTEAFTADEVPYNSLSLTITGTPLNSVSVKAGVSWKFTGQGPTVDLGSWTFETYTGGSLISSWPKAGASLGGGWAVAASSCVDAYKAENASTHNTNFQWHNTAKQHTTGDSMSLSASRTDVITMGPSFTAKLSQTGNPGVVWSPSFDTPTTTWTTFTTGISDSNGDVINIPAHMEATWEVFPRSLISASLSITIDPTQARNQKIDFTMVPDIQALLTLPGDYDTGQGGTLPDEEILDLSGADVGLPINGTAPLPDTKSSTYWTTERGLQSVEYTLLRARARLLAAQRVVQASWTVPFARAIDLTCRKSASLSDSRIPGGQLTGKIIAYSISATGGSRDQGGQLTGSVTVACSIGRGGTVAAVAGYNNDWSENDYVEDTHINVSGSTVVPTAESDWGYNPDGLVNPPTGEPSFNLNLTAADVIVKNVTHGSLAAQTAILQQYASSIFQNQYLAQYFGSLVPMTNEKQSQWAQACQQKMQTLMKDNSVWLELWLKPLSETALENSSPLDVLPLQVPQTIDLESASVG